MAATEWVRVEGCALRGQRPWNRREPAGFGHWARRETDLGPRPSLPKGRFPIEHEQSVSLNINRDVVWNGNES